MLALLLLQVAAPQTAIDAERAFNQAAQDKGQWTAFRQFAAEDGVMFVPEPAHARAWLKDRKDPPRPVQWAAAESYISCDGMLAVNTGGWKQPDGSVGYFTTVWHKQPSGEWKWQLDAGDTLDKPRAVPAEPRLVKASCAPINVPVARSAGAIGGKEGEGQSADGTLLWHWQVSPEGARSFDASLWDGTTFVPVVSDRVAAPK